MSEDAQGEVGRGFSWKGDGPVAHPPRLSADDRPPKFELFSVILPHGPNRADVPEPTQSPWEGIGTINLFDHGATSVVATGFLCAPDVLLTAKHVLTTASYDAGNVWLGFDAVHNPGAPMLSIAAYAEHNSLDLAVLILTTQHQGVFALGAPLPPAHAGVTLAGYAFPYPNTSARLSYGNGPLTGASGTQLTYLIDTEEGDSGAPVFGVPNGQPTVIAVHAEGAPKGQGNAGVWLTPAVVADIHSLIAIARSHVGH